MAFDDEGVAAYLARLDGEIRLIAHELCRRIGEIGPHLTVTLAWGAPCWRGAERVCSIRGQRNYCNLQLWAGSVLAEQFSRIEGTGKRLRHVKIRALADMDEAIDDIIEAAVELDGYDPAIMR